MTFVLFLIKKKICHFLGLWRWELEEMAGGGRLRAAQHVEVRTAALVLGRRR